MEDHDTVAKKLGYNNHQHLIGNSFVAPDGEWMVAPTGGGWIAWNLQTLETTPVLAGVTKILEHLSELRASRMHTTGASKRGCGTRDAGGLYACTGTSDDGRPMEEFIWDPPVPWNGGYLRSPRLHQRHDGRWDLLVWIGDESYPFVPDFVEEARRFGVSRRIPTSLDMSSIVPFQSRMIFIHQRVITPTFYELQERTHEILKTPCECFHSPIRKRGDTQCTLALWELSALESIPPGHELGTRNGGSTIIRTPSVQYVTQIPITPSEAPGYTPGIFMATPLTHFEFINPDGSKISLNAKKALGESNAGNHTVILEQ